MSLEVPAPVAVRMSNIPLYEGDFISSLDLIPVLYKSPTTGSYRNKLALRSQIAGPVPDQELSTTSQVQFAGVSATEIKAFSAEIEFAYIKNLIVGDSSTSATTKQVLYINHTGSSVSETYTLSHLLATEDVQVQVYIQSPAGDYYSLVITAIDTFAEGGQNKVRIHISHPETTVYKVVIVG